MSDEPISDAIRRLIVERLDSVPELEALLLLRDDPARRWTPDEAGKRLYVSTMVAGHILSTLTERGFFALDDTAYRFAPESPELRALVDQLAAAYSRQLVAVTQLIHSKPSRNVRDFADAFRLRKPK